MSVYKEIPKYNFKDIVYKNDVDPETGEVTPVPASQERYLFYRINKKQDLAGIVIPLYEEIVDPETGEVIGTQPVLQDKTVTPSLETQDITPDIGEGFLGLGHVIIEPIETVSSVTIEPTQNPQTITVNKYVQTIQVSGIDKTIDSDIKPLNIRHDVNILGVRGTYTGDQPISPVVNGHELIMYQAAQVNEDEPNTMEINR